MSSRLLQVELGQIPFSGAFRKAAMLVWLSLLELTLIIQPASAQKYSVLHAFSYGEGAEPSAGLIEDPSGNFYGTTVGGGAFGYGVVFKMSPSGQETVLHSFTGGRDGAFPQIGNLILDSLGNLYGTTPFGGITTGLCGSGGCGVAYKLCPTGDDVLLYSFTGETDGARPYAGLVRRPDGVLYGSASFPGNVFSLIPGGSERTLLSLFGECPDYNLILDEFGNLYGAARCGGPQGLGLIFKVSPAGKETVLHTFTGADGENPVGPLLRDNVGNIYGSTESGGTFNDGVVFELNPAGGETVLHAFSSTDGKSPQGGLIRDAAGNLYGATGASPSFNFGTIFELSPGSKLTTLYAFTSGSDGIGPNGSLVPDSSGNLYGTTVIGGTFGYGVVFKLALGATAYRSRTTLPRSQL